MTGTAVYVCAQFCICAATPGHRSFPPTHTCLTSSPTTTSTYRKSLVLILLSPSEPALHSSPGTSYLSACLHSTLTGCRQGRPQVFPTTSFPRAAAPNSFKWLPRCHNNMGREKHQKYNLKGNFFEH